MTTYHSKGHTSSGSPLAFETPANWNTETDGSGSDATSLAGHYLNLQGSHFMTLGADVTTGSVKLSGTLAGNDNTITTTQASSNKGFDHDGTITGDLNVTLTNSTAQADGLYIDASPNGGSSTGNINDLTLNLTDGTASNQIVKLLGATTIDGDLTITSGTLDTDSGSNHALTVAGQLTASGGSLLLNNSTVSFGAVMAIGNAGTVTCADTNLTTHSFSLGQGPFTAPSASGSFIITNETSNLAFDYDGNQFIHNGGTIDIRTQATTLVDFGSNNGTAHIGNVKINHASCVAKLQNAGSLLGNLEIALGTLDTDGNALTVAGDVSVVGTLTCNSSAVQCRGMDVSGSGTLTAPDASGSLTITGTQTGSSGNDAFDTEDGTTFAHSSGTITFTGNTNPQIRNRSGESFNNIVINTTGGTPIVETQRDIAIAGTLTIVEGTFRSYGTNARSITVTGDVSVEDGGTLGGGSANTANHSFGSLTIASGGTYTATSGTTTITSRTGGSGTYALENNGTFTHNKGTVAITDADNVVSMGLGSSLYNLTLSGGSKKIRNNTTINNNLTLTSGDLYGHSGSLTLDVLGQTILNGGTTGQNIAFSGTMNWGNVTVNSGTLKLSSGTNNAESFRNVGGTIQ